MQMTDSQLEAAIVLAREDFYTFLRLMFLYREGFKWLHNHHHKVICDELMAVFRGEVTRLVVNVPPRYSKTEIVIVGFSAWSMGKVPDSEFIHASYSGTLATINSWQVREMVQSELYWRIFPHTRIKSDSKAKDHWRTTAGGVFYATGFAGTITGFGAGKHREGFGGAILIDDPHKADEARSDTVRESVIDSYQNTIETRQNHPGKTPIVLIMQRLHERDLAGWMISGGSGEKWRHVCFPAIQADGTALWPEKHSIEALRRMQDAKPYTFAGQYQQSPSAPAGNIFKPDKMQVIDAVPVGTRFVRAWDFAATVEEIGKDPDWSAGAKLGITPEGRFVIADMSRFRAGPEDVRASLKNTAARDGANCRIRIPQDPGQAGKSQALDFVKMLSGFTVTALPVSGDKVIRAEPFASQVNVGNVMMVRGEWNDALISEMRMFPNGSHDDQVDACSDAFSELNINAFGLLDFAHEERKLRKEKQAEQTS